MFKNCHVIVGGGLLMSGLMGCGGFSTKSGDVRNPIQYSRMVGSWEGPCVANPVKAGEWKSSLVKFGTGGTFKQEDTLFADAGCQQPLYKQTMIGTAKLTGVNEDVSAAMDLDLKPEKLEIQSLSDAGAKRLNDEKLCGIIDWKNTATYSVLGFSCRNQTIDAHTVIKNMVDVRVNTLYFGKQQVENGVLNLGRPTAINRDVVYRKRSV